MRLDELKRAVEAKLLRKPRLPTGMDKISGLQNRLHFPPSMHDTAIAAVLTREHFGDQLALAERTRAQHDSVIDPFHQASKSRPSRL